MKTPAPIRRTAPGFLARLRDDVRGNALMIMAAMLIPLAAFSGSAIDMARLYTVKTRLQQACDAGALAGRKSMTTTLDTSSTGQAQTFFNNNFRAGWFKTVNVAFTPSLTSDNQVHGVATADVPMTIMAMFGQPTRTLTVNCQARFDSDIDIVFVLDTTGSMACTTADDPCGAATKSYTRTSDGTTGWYTVEESGSKIAGLRSAVLSFYDTLAKAVDASSQIRFGFVPYTSTVNVGKAITAVSSTAMVTKWQYQTRHAVNDNILTSDGGKVVTATSQANCLANASRTPALTTSVNPMDGSTITNYGYTSTGTAARKEASYTTSNGKSTCTVTTETVTPVWRYQQWPADVSGFVSSLATGTKVDDPSKVTSATSAWQGCIEERTTSVASSFDQSNLPDDLDPDELPVANVNAWGFPTAQDTRWRPMWPDITYYRGANTSKDDYGDDTTVTDYKTGIKNSGGVYTTPYGDYNPSWMTNDTDPYSYVLQSPTYSDAYYTCGMPAQRLTVITTRDQVSNYVNNNDFRAIGGTYHDTGMIWGTRLIAPNGLFANDTAARTGHPAPNRYIVFMTDGQMSPNQSIYGMYGMEYYDGRVTGKTIGSYSSTTDLNNHNARFVAECQAAKNRGITVFVVGFGQTLNTQLTQCASPNKAYYASDNTSLTAAFQSIAQQVALLRLSQ